MLEDGIKGRSYIDHLATRDAKHDRAFVSAHGRVSNPAQSYSDARAELYALVPRGIVLGLETMQSALDFWGNPQRVLTAVHIAGTNGKGSVSAMVEAALRASGLRVGLYTSPHLHHFGMAFPKIVAKLNLLPL